MIPLPHPWPALVVALAAYRLTRLGGWDDFPPIYRIRAWIIGERWIPDGPIGRIDSVEVSAEGLAISGTLNDVGRKVVDGEPLGPPQPGKEPSSEVGSVRPVYDRPLLAHLVHCPFCLGWWVSLATYLWWLLTPTWGLYVLAPFALSGFVGLVSKNLDP